MSSDILSGISSDILSFDILSDSTSGISSDIPTPVSYFREGGPQKSKLHFRVGCRGFKNVTYPPQAPSKRVQGGGGFQKNVTCGLARVYLHFTTPT